ncbi:protein crumbs-like isoform X2 [Eriocheir sinensis]|uniref:protein crumbs-like isoform X2 n=1 Tax=Eriocheir sinensis TaxID=95602 RepID=UPI0021C9CFEF|nr:protein crumbs-like isoform X2 [Eriocheir sinensis]
MAAWTTKGVTRQGVWVLAAAAVLVAAGALIPGAAAQHEGGVVSLPPPDDATVPEDPQEDTAAEVGGVGEDVGVSGEAERGDLTPGGGSREGHFSGGSARVVLPETLILRGYTSLSFRTCSHGTLLQQTGSGGDSLVLGVSEEGSLVLTLTQHGHAHTTTLSRSLNDNAWHRVYLKFELGVLTLGVGQATVVVANSTHGSASLLDLELWSASPQLTIGRNFTGCLLQGAGTNFTSNFALHTGVQWDACPLPDGTDCTGYQEDPCFAQPCGRRGECVAAGDSYACNCYTRYEGEQCQIDTGPLCPRTEFQCANGGLCQEDRQGNTTTCACPTGYIGATCQTPINENFCEADTHPCQNNATCTITAFSDSYECLCQPGYSGEHCEVNDNDCASQPCWNGGLCIDGINDFSCNCDGTGYVGDVCQDNIDECLPMSPCLNGATCYDLYGSYECACVPGYGGKHCELEVMECSSDPCQNGGTCTDLQNAYRCACLLGFEGDNCERNIDNCYNVTCPENSFCEDGVNEYVCRCSPGYSGSAPNCVEINECASSPCLNGATCYDDSNAYTCICGPGFSGRNCEVNIDDCAGAPCQHGGTCHDEVEAFTCECPAGFEGVHCEVNRDECALNVCVHATDCEDLIGDYTCHCEDGWAGKNCEDEVDECASSPCLNGASCKDRVNGFDCTCLPGFTGQTCETNIDECASTPCLNGGVCVDGINNYTCECGEAFMGTNCEEQYDACAAQPCHNGGSCITTRGDRSFYCECIPGFEGLYCSNNINDCFDVTCSDGKVCFDLVNSYECRCPEGFTGENCSVNIDECQSDPCLNGGECHDGRANYTCICLPGYTGHNCEEDVDECATQQPCINGICENTNGSYQCYCRPGFSGDHCNLEFDECLSHPCKNSGKNCEEDIAECESIPCLNGATCLERSNLTLYDLGVFDNFTYEEAGGFECECVPGFEGETCEVNIDECESAPCQKGECVDDINAYSCMCWPGYQGVDCETEINECELYVPCVMGTCMDKVADYECVCEDGYGGKNCSVELLGCRGVECLNGGECQAQLEQEVTHDFQCRCPHGFTGRHCEDSTTLSLAGASYAIMHSDREEGYELSFRFRTTLSSGILAVGQGETYIKLELLDGRLNVHSSLLNKWEGIFVGSELNDGEWQNVRLTVNDSHVFLAANNQTTLYPINPVQTINSSDTSFSTTVIGGATATLKILSKEAPFFTGCMENVVVDGVELVPRRLLPQMRVLVDEGCPRVEQCSPNPCLNEGQCVDLWSSYKCNCERPFLGDTCQLSFTPVTFGNEDTKDSLVTVMIPEVDHGTYRTHADVSMLVRTREPNGLIFYLGTHYGPAFAGVEESYILAELVQGRLVLRVLLGGHQEELFTVADVSLVDGESHLLHVKRINLELEVSVDHLLVLNTTLQHGGDLLAHVLYLGGVPRDSSTRVKRQLGVSNFTTTVTRPHFKGTLQDIRLSNGSETRLVQPFPLENVTAVVLPGDNLDNVQTHNVLEGTVSDDTCSSAPCMNGGTCNVTWNDFECACPVGYKGKTCEDREYCAIYECPEGSFCANLDDGYECQANLTLSGANSSLTFSPRIRRPPITLTDLQITYRSQVGGVLVHSHSSGAGVRVSLGAAGVVVQQDNGTSATATFTSNATLDGAWHNLKVTLDPAIGLQVLLDDTPLLGDDTTVIVDFKDLVLRGEIMLGGSPLDSVAHNLLDPTLASSPAPAPTSPAQVEGGSTTHMFRGCLGPSRVAGMLLPFFSRQELINNSAANQFYRREEQNTAVGCTVCYQEECVNGGFCSSPAEVYSCSCPEGFEGERCEVNIDECVGHQCLNGASCVDGISQYTCSCQPGYTGQWCEEDIDECAANPCQNGGECRNEIAHFVCLCPPDFIGVDCSELKVKNCSTVMCLNGGTCNDVMNPDTGVADDYECSCAFGYTGDNCEETEDFCAMNRIVCLHGTCNLTFRDQGWECLCNAGWEGALCQEEVDECLPDPCKNGGICADLVNGYNCTCLEGWEGATCEVDINECDLSPCANGGECVNLLGTFECECSELHCGQTCSLPSPCLGFNCTENGECVERCDEEVDEEPFAKCHCDEGWTGDDCAMAHVQFPTDLELAIIVGCVVGLMLIIAIVGLTVFLMMAKKKRQTRGTYSPSRQEFYSPRVEMGNMMKPPPEERLI